MPLEMECLKDWSNEQDRENQNWISKGLWQSNKEAVKHLKELVNETRKQANKIVKAHNKKEPKIGGITFLERYCDTKHLMRYLRRI